MSSWLSEIRERPLEKSYKVSPKIRKSPEGLKIRYSIMKVSNKSEPMVKKESEPMVKKESKPVEKKEPKPSLSFSQRKEMEQKKIEQRQEGEREKKERMEKLSEREKKERMEKILMVRRSPMDEEAGISLYAFDLTDAPQEMLDSIYLGEARPTPHNIWLDERTAKPIVKFHHWFGWINTFCPEEINVQDDKAFSTSDLQEAQQDTNVCWNYILTKMKPSNMYMFWEPTKFIRVYHVNYGVP
jgi:hypothetical protein